MGNRTLRVLLSCLVGVLLVTTYTVFICMDALVGPMLIKEIISSFCVGLCIGKVMHTIDRKFREEQERKKLEEDIKRLLAEMEDKYE